MQVVARDGAITTVRMQGADVETPVTGQVGARGEASLLACRSALENWFLVRSDFAISIGLRMVNKQTGSET